MRYFHLFFLTMLTLANDALAVDFDHYFNLDSITIEPIHSDYGSEAAFVIDSAVYNLPRVCKWRKGNNKL